MSGSGPITIHGGRRRPGDGQAVQVPHGRPVAIYAAAVLLAGLIVGLVAPVALEVPEQDSSVESLITILRSNLVLLGVLAACSGLQRFSFQELRDGKPPWIRRITDLVVACFITLNVAVVGFALGQLQGDALVRILPHAWLEVPAFALGVAGYLLARAGILATRPGIKLYLIAAAMLIAAAPIEAFITGSIR